MDFNICLLEDRRESFTLGRRTRETSLDLKQRMEEEKVFWTY